MAMVPIRTSKVPDMKATGKRISSMEKASRPGQKVLSTKENTFRTKRKAMGYTLG